MKLSPSIQVYLETGQQKTFACAVDWPGWCRSGKTQELALQNLFNYSSRYASAINAAGLKFDVPTSISSLDNTQCLEGNATTDFGSPAISLEADSKKVEAAEAVRFQSILKACWSFFDATEAKASGKTLRVGPRGGGRNLKEIKDHVLEAEVSYLARLGGKIGASDYKQPTTMRATILKTLDNAIALRLPEKGPRGGTRWTPRFFVRREAWHVLDHAWEIEDRLQS